MKRNLVESDIELAAIEWLEELGYTYIHGPTLNRQMTSVVLEDRLQAFLERQYPNLPKNAQAEAISQFTNHDGVDLHHRNRDFHIKLVRGIDLNWEDEQGQQQEEHVYAIDYQNIDNNEFLCVNQMTINGKSQRRPDVIVFVNGLPLVLFEFKNMFSEDTTIEEAFTQIKNYQHEIPLLFEYNTISIASDGLETKHGMYSSDYEWFAAWKSIDGKSEVPDCDNFELHTLLKGLFPKERLLNYIRNFIFHEDHSGKLIKKGAKYHQFFGVNFAVEVTQKAIKPIGDGKIGVIWHTQGSGKSISMAIYTGILRRMETLKNPTILVQVDRRDLDFQLYENFVLAKNVLNCKPKRAKDVDDLREKLRHSEGGEVLFTTIEKFKLKSGETAHPVLSNRENIIVIADEAHRTQYGLLHGFAANLRKALPEASFIGFTGTPVDSKDADTEEVFGNVIHTYDIRQAVEDKATVAIFYEPRLVRLHLENEGIDEEAEEILEGTKEGNHLKWAALEDAAGADKRVKLVANDILTHYTNRTASLAGKAMIVCMSRRNCVKMYEALQKLPNCPEVAVVMTSNISKDPESWHIHRRTKKEMEAIKKRFRKPSDPLKIVIVRDMWLTGFDAPCVHTMYVDKIMQGHNLMQAITRVNRVFGDKPSGVVVDYIGIGNRLKDATHKYSSSGGQGTPTIDIHQAMEWSKSTINWIKRLYLPEKVDYSQWRALSRGNKFLLVSKVVNHIIKDDKKSDDFLKEEKKLSNLVPIVKSHPGVEDISVDIVFIQHVGKSVRKLKAPRDKRKKAKAIKELVARSIESDEIVDVFRMAGIETPDISILDEEFLLGAKEQKEGAAIKVELMRQLLKDEIKLRLPKNISKYRSLKEQIEEIIKRYHNNAIDSYTTISELFDRAKELREGDKRIRELGLTEEELAFYDILDKHKAAIKDNSLIKDIVQKVHKSVIENLRLDWSKKANLKATIKVAVRKHLLGKVELPELKKILAEIMEQAEAQYKDYPMVG